MNRDVTDLGLKWDVMKMEIRSFTIQTQYSILIEELDQKKTKKINQLLIKLNDLPQKICSSRNDHNLLNEYHTLKAKLEKPWNKKIKGTVLRSKARWYENGEKNSKYFLHLEKRNFLSLVRLSCHAITNIFVVNLIFRYVPVNSKTTHPPRAIPWHLTRIKLRTVGNLTQN